VSQVNILVEESGRALLCDFGLSRIKADATSRTAHIANTMIAGSRNWMAPKLLSGSLPKLPSDINSFGMTLFEVTFYILIFDILILLITNTVIY
jgi:serine/threonine protein kinase